MSNENIGSGTGDQGEADVARGPSANDPSTDAPREGEWASGQAGEALDPVEAARKKEEAARVAAQLWSAAVAKTQAQVNALNFAISMVSPPWNARDAVVGTEQHYRSLIDIRNEKAAEFMSLQQMKV